MHGEIFSMWETWIRPHGVLKPLPIYQSLARFVSGLRYVYANIVAWAHYLLLWVAMLSSFCCDSNRHGFGSFFTQSAALVPILMVSKQHQNAPPCPKSSETST